MDKKLAKK